jgi:hypothetical protein
MNFFDWYFRAKVTASKMDEQQTFADAAIRRLLAKNGIYGLISSVAPAVSDGGAGFVLEIDNNPRVEGFDLDGEYVALPELPDPYVTPDLGTLFTLPTPGNEKKLAIILRFDRVLSQPELERVGPVFLSVNFRRTEYFAIGVIEGASAGVGLSVAPTIPANEPGIYLADITVLNGITDFTTSTIVTTNSRQPVNYLAEAVDRGLDGKTSGSRLAFIGGVNGLRFRDITGSNLDLEAALLAALAAGASALNRLGTIADINAIQGIYTPVAGAHSFVSPGTYTVFSTIVPAATRYIYGRMDDSAGVSFVGLSFLINVATGNITWHTTTEPGAAGAGSGASGSVILASSLPLSIGLHFFDVSTIQIFAYSGIGGAISIRITMAGLNVHAGSTMLIFIK